MAWTDLKNANVTAVAFDVPWRDHIDQLVRHFLVVEVTLNLTNAVNSHQPGVLGLLCLGN